MSQLGFTGTQRGTTRQQMESVGGLLIYMFPDEVHHGDCIGADEEFHDAVEIVLRPLVPFIHVHPPSNPRKRAWKQGDVIYEPRPYMDRNQDIVDAIDALIATPRGFEEELRSGTWATVRRARKKGIPVFVVLPNGKVEQS